MINKKLLTAFMLLLFLLVILTSVYSDKLPNIYFSIVNGHEFQHEKSTLKLNENFFFIENDPNKESYIISSSSFSDKKPIVAFLKGKIDFARLENNKLIMLEKEIKNGCYLYRTVSSDNEYLVKDSIHQVFFSITKEYINSDELNTVCSLIE